MGKSLYKACVWAGAAVLGFSGLTWIADAPAAGAGVVESFDKDGFTATAAGHFVDHWKKLR